jgi:hypothetical protein
LCPKKKKSKDIENGIIKAFPIDKRLFFYFHSPDPCINLVSRSFTVALNFIIFYYFFMMKRNNLKFYHKKVDENGLVSISVIYYYALKLYHVTW